MTTRSPSETAAALVVTDGLGGFDSQVHDVGRALLAGLTLTERAVLALQRAGLDSIHIAGPSVPDEALARLRARGLTITWTPTPHHPFATVPVGSLLVVLPVVTVVEPAAIVALLERAPLGAGEGVVVVDRRPEARHRFLVVENGRVRAVLAHGNAAATGAALLTPGAVELVRYAPSVRSALGRLARSKALWAISLEPRFCRRLHGDDWSEVERALIWHSNGGSGESFFTKQVRRASVPLTRRLLRLPVTANQVTVAGLALSMAAGAVFAAGGYWSGLAGATFYYASTVLDCSDGEIARAKYGESSFGCWLETVADYASYVFAWAGIAMAAVRLHPQSVYSRAALLSIVSSLLMFLFTAYLRHRVVRASPGQLDETVAATLALRGRVHRFSGWARQWIKRSTLAHVLLFLAFVGRLEVILFLWAFGASAALLLSFVVHGALVNRVPVPLAGGGRASAGGGSRA